MFKNPVFKEIMESKINEDESEINKRSPEARSLIENQIKKAEEEEDS
jgi:hypothetical protein